MAKKRLVKVIKFTRIYQNYTKVRFRSENFLKKIYLRNRANDKKSKIVETNRSFVYAKLTTPVKISLNTVSITKSNYLTPLLRFRQVQSFLFFVNNVATSLALTNYKKYSKIVNLLKFQLIRMFSTYFSLQTVVKKLTYYKTWVNLNSYHSRKILLLNFLRYRLFPKIYNYREGYQYLNLSLGMVSWRYKKNKSFKKNKLVYLILSNFLRKILLYSSIKYYTLVVKKLPIHFKEIINTLLSPVISPYAHPFNLNKIVEEKFYKNPFYFTYVMFYNSKPYGKLKLKKKGRLKRKITKKITLLNRLVD